MYVYHSKAVKGSGEVGCRSSSVFWFAGSIVTVVGEQSKRRFGVKPKPVLRAKAARWLAVCAEETARSGDIDVFGGSELRRSVRD